MWRDLKTKIENEIEAAEEDQFCKRLVEGILFPGAGVCWGIVSIVSGEIVIPIQWIQDLPVYRYIPVHGWEAIFLASALISICLAAHFFYFWGQFSRWERVVTIATMVACWVAVIFFAAGVFAFLANVFSNFF